MKTTIVIFMCILTSCAVFCVLDNDNLFKAAPTYKSLGTGTLYTHYDTINQSKAMDILKAGYYMGGVRQRQHEDLDKYWKSDSLYFVKSFFTTIK
jgi:hypothetical protein